MLYEVIVYTRHAWNSWEWSDDRAKHGESFFFGEEMDANGFVYKIRRLGDFVIERYSHEMKKNG